MPKLHLPVDLVIVDSVDYDKALFTLNHCLNLCSFNSVKFFTHFDGDCSYIHKIDKIKSREEYSNFIIYKMPDYIKSDHVLIIQSDGFIVNPSAWTSDFLKYDYIGAPWHTGLWNFQPHEKKWVVGNGGFSLRSKKLAKFVQTNKNIYMHPLHSEDGVLCTLNRVFLEKEGFSYAPKELAHQFSSENFFWNNSFGHHQYFSLDPRIQRSIKLCPADEYTVPPQVSGQTRYLSAIADLLGDLTQVDYNLRLRHAIEELGEVAKASRNLKENKGPIYENQEMLIEETVDAIICCYALFVAAGGKTQDFDDIFYKKITKWRSNI